MFNCLKFIDDMMMKLNEADEMPMEDDAEMGGDDAAIDAAMEDVDAEGGEAPAEGGEGAAEGGAPMEGEAAQDPSQIADAEMGTFVSPIAKANWANMMIKFLKNTKPEIIIPSQFETVTTDNADQVIEFVKGAGLMGDDEFGDELNNI
jgi:hypothetical protein